jgi:uncharacterized protein (DUF1778 family)
MTIETRTTDAKARVTLRRGFTNPAVLIEEDRRLPEETRPAPSDRDRDRFLELLDNPPEPTAALRRAFAQYGTRHE